MARLVVAPDGTVRYIYSDDLHAAMAPLGESRIRRASHVEPDEGGGGWLADMAPVGGPVLGPFASRREALAREVAWLTDHWIPSAAAQS